MIVLFIALLLADMETTSGKLEKKGSNFYLNGYVLAFDDKDKDAYNKLLKQLDGWIGKEVIATHLKGHVEIGKLKVLLTNKVELQQCTSLQALYFVSASLSLIRSFGSDATEFQLLCCG